MKRQKHTPEQIIRKLRSAEQMLLEGKTVGEAAKALEVSEQTLHRWRNQYGGMKAQDVKRLKELEHENRELKQIVADQTLPMAHTAWLRLVANGYRGKEANLPGLDEIGGQIEYLTQSAHIGEVRLPRAAGEEAAPRLLSVVQSADAYEGTATVRASDRRQVLDGVVRYGDQLAVVIESKLDLLADDRQVREINVGDSGWQVDTHFAAVAWREVIEAWRRLLDRELLGHAEADILRDFLFFAQRHFPRLQPFSSLSSCRDNEELAVLRLEALFAGTFPEALTTRERRRARLELSGPIVQYAYLEPTAGAEASVGLWLWPGDTLGQSQALYGNEIAVQGLAGLTQSGWHIEPSFHFGHINRGYVTTRGSIGLEDYLALWQERIGSTRQLGRDEWADFMRELVVLRIATKEDVAEFDRVFTHSKRQSATPRPGLRARFSWPFEEAAELDDAERLGAEIIEKLSQFLGALGETVPGPSADLK